MSDMYDDAYSSGLIVISSPFRKTVSDGLHTLRSCTRRSIIHIVDFGTLSIPNFSRSTIQQTMVLDLVSS